MNSHPFMGIGRLRPGVAVAQAQRELERLTARLPELFPNAYSTEFMREYHFGTAVTPLRDEMIGETAKVLWTLFGAVGLVLLIACANVANLFLVRAEAQRRERAIRSALGADRAHMAVHYLTESTLLSVLAGVCGLGIAGAAIHLLRLSRHPTFHGLESSLWGGGASRSRSWWHSGPASSLVSSRSSAPTRTTRRSARERVG